MTAPRDTRPPTKPIATSDRARAAQDAEQQGYDDRQRKYAGPNPHSPRADDPAAGDVFLARAWMAGWRRHAHDDPYFSGDGFAKPAK